MRSLGTSRLRAGPRLPRSRLVELLDLLYPPRCGGCEAPGAWVCADCRRSREPARAPRLPHLRDVAALGRFTGTLRTAVHRMKYAGEAVLADVLGAELGLAIAGGLALGWRVDVVVPVPLAPGRARERGYDQARRLARAAGRVSGARYALALGRARETKTQVGLGRDERAANVRDAFASTPLAGGVALVDDVLTTGATLVECARTLRRAGAVEVRAVVVAIET